MYNTIMEKKSIFFLKQSSDVLFHSYELTKCYPRFTMFIVFNMKKTRTRQIFDFLCQ